MRFQLVGFAILAITAFSGCRPSDPIIGGTIEKMEIHCLDSERKIEITDSETLQEVRDEINSSSREDTHEYEMDEGHSAVLSIEDETELDMTFYHSGKAVIEGYYVHSELEEFCGE